MSVHSSTHAACRSAVNKDVTEMVRWPFSSLIEFFFVKSSYLQFSQAFPDDSQRTRSISRSIGGLALHSRARIREETLWARRSYKQKRARSTITNCEAKNKRSDANRNNNGDCLVYEALWRPSQAARPTWRPIDDPLVADSKAIYGLCRLARKYLASKAVSRYDAAAISRLSSAQSIQGCMNVS